MHLVTLVQLLHLQQKIIDAEGRVEKFEKIKNDLVATVKIVCEIISVKKDKEGKVILLHPSQKSENGLPIA